MGLRVNALWVWIIVNWGNPSNNCTKMPLNYAERLRKAIKYNKCVLTIMFSDRFQWWLEVSVNLQPPYSLLTLFIYFVLLLQNCLTYSVLILWFTVKSVLFSLYAPFLSHSFIFCSYFFPNNTGVVSTVLQK